MRRNGRNIIDFIHSLRMHRINAYWMSEREKEVCEHLVMEGKVRKHVSRWFGTSYEWIKATTQ